MLQGTSFTNGTTCQLFLLEEGRTKKTAGTFSGIGAVSCVVDGQITVVYPTATSETIDLTQGDCFGFAGPVDITIVTGAFHMMGHRN